MLVRESLHFCFYMHRDQDEAARGLLRALDIYREAVGPQALGIYGDPEGEWQTIEGEGWEFIRSRLREGRWAITQLREESKENRYAFEYFGKPVDAPLVRDNPDAMCAAYFRIPTEFLEEHGPEEVRALALQLAAPLPFTSGHVGLELAGELDLVGAMQRVNPWCFRYPGLDVFWLEHVSWEIGTHVRGPAWLTFLGQPALSGLGGITGLRSRLHSPGTTVEPLNGDRAVITLGTWPEAGDIEQGQTLPQYRELARVLEPWLYREKKGIRGFTPEEAHRWERRFLD
jgi:hypothetical protein